MTDKTLEDKLKKLTETGDKMQAVRASIQEKQDLIDNLKSNQSKFDSLPAVSLLAKDIIEKLETEIGQEQTVLQNLQEEIKE